MKGTTTDYSYIGVGQIYMRDRNQVGGGLVPIGNVSALTLAVSEETKAQRDYARAGGGTKNEVRRIEGVEASITIHDLSAENLALALYGDATAVDAGTVSQEVITVVKGALVPLAHVGPTDVVVTEDTDTDPATYTAGTDYEVRPGGIWFPSTTTIPGATVRVAYSHPAQDVVQALTQAAGEYELLFDGINEARSGKASVVRIHRLRFGPAAALDLIGDDYAGLELTGTLLTDDTQGAGLSRFFNAKVVQ
jgi:hypothetical protein